VDLDPDRVALPHPTSVSRNPNQRCGLSTGVMFYEGFMSRVGLEPATR